jgi:flavodoxin
MKSLLILVSYHHENTKKIANVFAKVLDSQIKNPRNINPEELREYDLVGFGSGIYAAKHHKSILDLVDELPQVNDKSAFIFSTCTFKRDMTKNHSTLKKKLQSKGYKIADEFVCKGRNTNSFSRFFGGLNRGRPNTEDLKNAEEFAQKLKQNLQKR